MRRVFVVASNNEEIEVKIKLTDSGVDSLTQWLSTHAVYKDKVLQEEYYLDNPKDSWFLEHDEGYRYALKYLRVRFTKHGDFVCYKDWETGPQKGVAGLYCKDIEYKVPSGEQALALFNSLGYTDITKFSKTRKSFHYKDFEIAVDSVEGLGVFFEFEVKNRLYDDQHAEYQRLISFIENDLGISNYTIQKQGFIVLLWNTQHDFTV